LLSTLKHIQNSINCMYREYFENINIILLIKLIVQSIRFPTNYALNLSIKGFSNAKYSLCEAEIKSRQPRHQ
jgi:hypothetical protein